MSRPTHTPGETWPRLMRAKTAAAYVDETSVDSFLRGVGAMYPHPINVSGKGKRWLREDLDRTIDRLTGRTANIQDAADVL
jgi:hypothetical protein